jgi:hypothetical protein
MIIVYKCKVCGCQGTVVDKAPKSCVRCGAEFGGISNVTDRLNKIVYGEDLDSDDNEELDMLPPMIIDEANQLIRDFSRNLCCLNMKVKKYYSTVALYEYVIEQLSTISAYIED